MSTLSLISIVAVVVAWSGLQWLRFRAEARRHEDALREFDECKKRLREADTQ